MKVGFASPGAMMALVSAALFGASTPLAKLLLGSGVDPWLLAGLLGLARTSASSASLLLNVEGLATMAIAWLVFKENVDRRLLLGA